MVFFDVSCKPRGNAKTKACAILAREKPMENIYMLTALNYSFFI